MKRLSLLLPLVFLLGPHDDRAQVLVLGTFHFANPGLDLINVESDDMLAEGRQKEIEAVVEALARFQPTKIVVELEPSREEWFNERYTDYVRGERELGANELEQLGMRLARKLGHTRLYGADSSGNLDFDAAFGFAQQNGQTLLVEDLQEQMADVQERLAEMHAPGRTVKEILRSHNSIPPEMANAFYMSLAEIGDAVDPIGAEVAAAWYARNLRIFANIARLVGNEDERVLVIFGSGHRKLLVEFVEEHPHLASIDPLDYL